MSDRNSNGRVNKQSFPNNRRNKSADFLKFILCCIVCIHHFRKYGEETAFCAGYLAVDVFFLLSGLFLMNHFLMHRTDETGSPEQEMVEYMIHKLIHFLPAHILAWVLNLLMIVYVLKESSMGTALKNGFWEFLLLKATGLGNWFSVNPVTWYLSALCLCSAVIYWILCRLRKAGDTEGKTYTHIIAPFLFLWIMSYLAKRQKNLSYWTQSAPVLTTGFLRGMADMSLGCTAAVIIRKMNLKRAESVWGDMIASVFEVTGWTVLFMHMFRAINRLDYIVPVVSAVLLISMFTQQSVLTRLTDNRISAFLGRYSYPMYLNQLLIIRPLIHCFPGMNFWAVTVCMLAGLLVVSILTEALLGYASRLIRGNKPDSLRNSSAENKHCSEADNI